MTVRWANAATGRTCTKCGVYADGDRIFCANCGAVLQTPVPLIKSVPTDYSHHFDTTSPTKGTIAKFILLGFPLSLLLDIVVGVVIPDRVMNLALEVIASALLFDVLLVALGTVTKNRWGINKTCELPCLQFSDASSAATEIIETSALGRLDVWEVWL